MYIGSQPFLHLDPSDADEGEVKIGIVSTPTLTRHALNKAVTITYHFHEKGVHQLVVALQCISPRYEHIPLREEHAEYRLTNFPEKDYRVSDTKCLDLHSYAGNCDKFQVRFTGAARDSILAVDDVFFFSHCGKTFCYSRSATYHSLLFLSHRFV